MSSPPRYEHQIQAEIKKRILPQALTPNDLDFYQRKTRRLEADNSQLSDELNKLRVRLRRSQDFEIKYESLLADHYNIKKELEVKERVIRELKTLNEKLSISVDERSNKHEEWGIEKRGLLEEIQKWTLKAEESEVRRIAQLATQRAKCEQAVKRQAQIVRKQFQEKEQEFKFQIKQLKKIIHQKETVENIINNRVEKVRKEKDQQIARLSGLVDEEKQNRANSIEQKNEEISRLKQKFEKMINFELENIKKNLEDQGEVFSIELNGLKQIIAIKNDQITKLLSEIKRQAVDHQKQTDGRNAQISKLKEQIYKIQREGQLQLYNLRQKLMEIQAADLRDLEKRYQQLIETLRADKSQLQNFLREKERLRSEERNDYDRNIQQLQDKMREREQRITSLLDRIKESGDLNTGQLKDLHQSFHKIEVEKENLTSQYQNNITFMQQQIAKLTATNEIKNAEIKKLYEQLHQAKQKFQEDLKEVDQRMKKERKQFQEQKERDRKERERMAQNYSASERDFKNAERRLIREKQKQERQKNKLKFLVQELERDVQRLNKYIKSLDDNLKNEYKKSQMNILDGDGSRRDAVSKLEKQRVQLQTLKSIEVDQIKRKYELDTTKVIQQNEKLKTDLLNKSIALEKAEAEVKKLDYQQRNMEKINKEKLFDYEKKMATLNSEINLTQELYKAFTEAKARKKS